MVMAEAARSILDADAGAGAHDPRTLTDGEQVAGRYEVKRFVARGGMGEVYEALDTILGDRVAIKTLPVTDSDRRDAAEGLFREVRIARKVVHPNVCRILELGVHRRRAPPSDPIPFLTMDFLVGETVAQRISRAGRLAPAVVFQMAGEMVAGLRAIHDAGIVHRDFKSDNVFLVRREGGNERAVVMDFGLARVLEGPLLRRSSNGRLMVGTPAYMAPEQLLGRPATRAADVYALGTVVFEMLTGRLPFLGDSVATAALPRLHQAPPSPSSLVPELGEAWDDLIRQSLERDPKLRLATVDDFRMMMERIGRRRPATTPVRRRAWLMWGGLAVGFVATGLTLGRAPAVHQKVAVDRHSGGALTGVPTETGPLSRARATTEGIMQSPAVAPMPRDPLAQGGRPSVVRWRRERSNRGALVRVVDTSPTASPQSASPASSSASTDEGAESVAGRGYDLLAPATRSRRRHPDDLIDPF